MRDNVLAIDAWLADGSLATLALDSGGGLPDGRLGEILPTCWHLAAIIRLK